MRVAFMTDKGYVRSQNQDAVYATAEPIGRLDNLFMVADGMGGHNAGDYASARAIQMIRDCIATSDDETVPTIHQGIRIANTGLYQEANLDVTKSGMGTTIVVATLEDDTLRVANVGDSRLYVLHDGELCQVTRDHSVIEEMVQKGEVTREFAQHHPKRNLITRAVGAEEDIRIDFFDVDVADIHLVLLCTDGLTTMVEDARIQEILGMQMTLEDKVKTLVQEANDAGGKDNITVVLVEF